MGARISLPALAKLFNERLAASDQPAGGSTDPRPAFLESLGFRGLVEQQRALNWWNGLEFPSQADVRKLRGIFGEEILSIFC